MKHTKPVRPLLFGILAVAFCHLVLACGLFSNSPYPHYDKEPDPRNQPYRVGIADRLRVNVWREPELSTEGTVTPAGKFTMPLIGNLSAVGKTTGQLNDEISERLEKYLKQRPVVTVEVVEVNSYRFTVSGNVAHAGVFAPNHYITVAEAIALAGGPNQYADTGGVVLIRRDADGSLRRIPIDYKGILEGKTPEQDIAVVSGDKVYVP